MSNILNNTTRLQKVLDALQTKATPSGGTDTNDATATASDILSGKTAYVKGEKITGNISSKTAATYTPTTVDQTISSGVYLSGDQIIKGDENLKAENIKNGVSIFDVTGTLTEGGNSNTSRTINIDVTLSRGYTIYYLDANQSVCTLTGTSLKGNTYNIDAYNGLIYASLGGVIYGTEGNFVQYTTDHTYENQFVMFLEDGGKATTVVLGQ